MTTPDPYDLDRFVAAQDAGGSYGRAIAELRAGRKTGHWMWFVFPQLAGLGLSATAQRFAISSLGEARAYLRHPVLGPRLTQCATILTELGEQTAERGKQSAEPGKQSAEPGKQSAEPGKQSAEPGKQSAEQVFGEIDAMKLRSSMTLFSRAGPSEPAFGAVLGQYFDGKPDPLTDRLLADAGEGDTS
jgi:uncharacterized protein (DUF1810 family)